MNTLFRNHASYATALTVAAAVSVTLAGRAASPISRHIGIEDDTDDASGKGERQPVAVNSAPVVEWL